MKPNGGLSSARNAGLGIATGDYVLFVDSDDFLMKDTVEKLLSAIEKGSKADFAFCDFLDSKRPDLSEAVREKGEDPIVMDLKGFKGFLSDHWSREYVDAVVAWNKLYRRSFLEGMLFPEGRWHEDEFFVNAILSRMERCVFLPEKLYFYRENEESITGAKNRFDVRHLDVFDAYAERVRIAKSAGDRGFAEKTALNGFEKLLTFLRDADASDEDTDSAVKAIRKKYSAFYRAVFGTLNPKRKLKYFAGIFNYRLLIKR